MADEPEQDRMARFRLLLPEDPAKSDVLHLTVDFLDIKINLRWTHHNQHEILHLMREFGPGLIRRCGYDYEQALGATQIEADLSALFPEDEAE